MYSLFRGTLGKKQESEAMLKDGQVTNLLEPVYHGNPIDAKGSLVVTDFGRDLCNYIYESSKMFTTVIRINDKQLGIGGKFIELFVS
ncbi:MAG: hypothetical protein CVU69_02675 [Deltaproteobacteria bacterium HGW-Deltaproteobacteria-4]|nr:MAG: hypothetical protein CVU69_02675 [Deltaproteobacteria bacterium HGW-Deltaproteobacteria-4]